MATHDYVLDNASGAAFRTDLNNALAAIVSNNSNSSEPATKYAYQWWADTSANVLKIRNSSNNAWITLFTLAGGLDVDSASNFNEDVTFTGASANIVFDKSDSALEFADNAKAVFGTGGDLEIFHNASHSVIADVGTGNLQIRADDFRVTDSSNSETMIAADTNSAVELYHNNVKVFETTSTGANVTFTSDAVLQITTTGTSDSHDARLEIITQESSFIIQNDRSLGTDGALTIGDGSKTYFQATKDTGVELYYDNAKHFETNSGGVKVNDNKYMAFGNGNDFQILHDGSTNIIDGQFHPIELRHQSEVHIKCIDDGAVELYHNNSEKLSTVSNGIEVTGHVRPPSARDNTDDIGGSGQRWDDIFATNSTIQTSDEKEKENISDTDLGLDFINKLSPKSFKFKGKTRTHYGLIAQDIETVITNLGKTTTQFAPLIKNTLEDGTESYGLRYTELLSPLIKAVQELSAKVVALESA